MTLSFKPLLQEEYKESSGIYDPIVVSCILSEKLSDVTCNTVHWITSVDILHLLERILGYAFPTEVKNRVRRYLDHFKPKTASKTSEDVQLQSLFDKIMAFPEPQPRNIMKDIKVFQWGKLPEALNDALSKLMQKVSSAMFSQRSW